MYSNKLTTLSSLLFSKPPHRMIALILTFLLTGWGSVQATPENLQIALGIPNHGDGNNDGIADVQQPHVASLPDKVTGQYITLELSDDCTIADINTDLVETATIGHPPSLFPQGLLYFDARCSHSQVTLYFHGLHQLDQHWVLRKYGPHTPGDTNTIDWYLMPNVTFDTVTIDGQPVVRARYTLTDGELGDDTGVDGHLVDPNSVSVNTDVDNVISFLSKSYTASIEQGVATITVVRNGSQGGLSVSYTTADYSALDGQDYQATSGTLSWADGERGEKTVTVNLLGSATPNRLFTVALDNLIGGSNSNLGINLATVTLTTDNIPPTVTSSEVNFVSFSSNHFSARKQDGIATLTVVRKGTTDAMSVDYATRDKTALAGRDYQSTTGKLSWAQGDVSEKTITIALPSGAVTNTDFWVTLSNLTTTGPTTILGLNPTVVTITDFTSEAVVTGLDVNNVMSFTTKSFTASRRAGEAVVTVNREGTQGTLSVIYNTIDNTAYAGRDYQPVTGRLSWADGERGDKSFTITLSNNATVGTLLNLALNKLTHNGISAPATTGFGIRTATLEITDEAVPIVSPISESPVTFTADGYKVLKTDGIANLAVKRGGNSVGALSVNYTTQNGTALEGVDYQTTSGTLSWANGDSGEKTLSVPLLASATAGNAFIVRLSDLTGTSGKISDDTAVLTIVDNISISGGGGSTGTGTSSGGVTTPDSSSGGNTGVTSGGSSNGTNDGIGAVTDRTGTPSATTAVPPSPADPNGEIYNAGGQALPPFVSETGSISYAIVWVDTENHGLLSNLIVESGATLSGGQLTGTIINRGTIRDVEFLGISLSGGTLAGTILNNSQVGGAIHDVTLAPNTVLSGGKLGGLIQAAPDSFISDVQLVANTTINGGTLSGNITGDPNSPATIVQATITAGTTLAYVTVISPIEFSDGVTVGANVTLPPPEEIAVNNVLAPAQIQNLEATVLTTLPPEAINTLEAEDIRQIPPPAFSGLTAEQSAALSPSAVAAISGEQAAHIPPAAFSGFHEEQVAVLPPEAVAEVTGEQVAQIPPPAFQTVTAEQMAAVQKEALGGMTPAQFFYLPTESLTGLTSENMGGLSSAVMKQFTKEQLDALQSAEFQKMPAAEVGKLVTGVDRNKVSVEDVAPLIPPSWKLEPTTGALTPPVGTPLTFQEIPPPEDTSPLVILPPLANLDSSFGVGGQGGNTAKTDMNQVVQQTISPQLALSQNPRGIVEIKGIEEYQNVGFSFICPAGNWTTQGDPQIPSTVEVTEGGFYQVTTATAQQFTMIPAPKDPDNLSKVLGNSSVIVGKDGDVFLEVPNSTRQSGRAREVVLFDSQIEPAPTDFCEEIAGEMVCDFENAPPEWQPGIHEVIEEGPRQKTGTTRRKRIVYSDGTAQILYPTVLSPNLFVNQVQTTLTEVEKVVLQANGTFKMLYQGSRYLANPNFEVKSRELKANEEISPNVVIEKDGHLIYTVTLKKPTIASGTRQVEDQVGQAREVLVFDLLLEPAPEDRCEEIAGLVVCDVENDVEN